MIGPSFFHRTMTIFTKMLFLKIASISKFLRSLKLIFLQSGRGHSVYDTVPSWIHVPHAIADSKKYNGQNYHEP